MLQNIQKRKTVCKKKKTLTEIPKNVGIKVIQKRKVWCEEKKPT